MGELIKIREISSKYDVSARTLRYYEDMGLLSSTRSSDYAYRLYDQEAVKRLEQILILRKLNICIKDIQHIFHAPGSDMVLDILGKKVADIDGEAALLQDLREILVEFIGLIRQSDFSRDRDVRRLYEKASKIESSIANISYQGNSSRINRLLEVTDKLKKLPEISIIRIQPFRAFSSGRDTLDNVMGAFQQWQEEHNHLVREMLYGAPDFLWFEEDGSAEWIWAVKEGVTQEDTAPYDLITFEGGLYASAMSVDGDDDIGGRIYEGIRKWLEESGFESGERPGHRTMGHMVNPTEEIRQALGYHQMEIFVPIKIRARHWRKEG
ncbi:MAG: MerR family transcriptional regulator [Lachnospiraceae bacterium]|jgi:DNA-binding transcriptional MerR regulator|nr:MerR family transcriptional regulator [Lachnospiraceae bacterium]